MTHPTQSPTDSGNLAAELTEVILAVDGAVEVYPAKPLWKTAVGAVLNSLGAIAEASPVTVRDTDAGPEIHARIAVSGDHSTPEVSRSVAAAVRSHLDPVAATVHITVARITTG